MTQFVLGHVVSTIKIAAEIAKDPEFAQFVMDSLHKRYVNSDWGDTCEEDAKANDYAVTHDERILAVYKMGARTIWIITEWDRSATTILFPEEY